MVDVGYGRGDPGSSYGGAAGFPALGFNPAPGELASVQGMGTRLRSVAGELSQTHHAVNELALLRDTWRGDAAQAFSASLEELPALLRRASQALGDAGRALGQWSQELARLQDQAHAYEREAEAAQRRLQAAKSDPALELARNPWTLEGLRDPLTDQEQVRLNQARADVDAARAELDHIIARAHELAAAHGQAAGGIERVIRDATDAAPTQSLLDQVGGAIEPATEWAKGLWNTVWDFAQRHAELIAWAGDVLGLVSGGLALAALFCAATGVGLPLAGGLAVASLVTGSAALTAHGVAKAAGAEVSWITIILDAVGVGLGGAARLAGRGVAASQAMRDTYKANKEWSAAKELLHGKMHRQRAVRDYSGLGGEAHALGSGAHSGVKNQYRELWDSDQRMGGKDESGKHGHAPACRSKGEVGEALRQAAEIPRPVAIR